MRRLTVLLLMLFAMLWQPVALARAGSTMNALVDFAHVMLHWQEAGHHHHEDGSYHLDESSESVQHILSDHGSSIAALAMGAPQDFPVLGSAAPGDLQKTLLPNPTLDGLLRPPRLQS